MKRGEVVLASWPYSDFSGIKPRPAVVMQADFLNRLIADTVLVQVTSVTRKAVTEVLLDPKVETKAGLKHVSYAVCNNLLTMAQVRIVRTPGTLSPAALQQIEDGIRIALELT